MTTYVNSNQKMRLLFQKIFLFVLVFFVLEIILYFVNVDKECLNCTSDIELTSTENGEDILAEFEITGYTSVTNETDYNYQDYLATNSSNEMQLNLTSTSSFKNTSYTEVTSITTQIPLVTSPHQSTQTTTTIVLQSNIIAKNRKCLEHLLKQNIVEYYYFPKNDDDNLNFTTRGIRSKKRLKNEYTKPSLVLLITPTDTYDATILPTDICSQDIRHFMPNMRARDYDLMRNLLKFFKHVAALAGMEYYLNYGSLLGHVRFDKRPIPWDDDMDISIDHSTIKKFKKIFNRERKIYFGHKLKTTTFLPALYVGSDRMKIFDMTQSPIRQYEWSFPFLDLFFYSVPDEDFYDMTDEQVAALLLTDGAHSGYSVKISLPLMLPLQKEPFLGIKLMVPVEKEAFLKLIKYDKDNCSPLSWSHRFENHREGSNYGPIPCSLLEGFYEF